MKDKPKPKIIHIPIKPGEVIDVDRYVADLTKSPEEKCAEKFMDEPPDGGAVQIRALGVGTEETVIDIPDRPISGREWNELMEDGIFSAATIVPDAEDDQADFVDLAKEMGVDIKCPVCKKDFGHDGTLVCKKCDECANCCECKRPKLVDPKEFGFLDDRS